MTLSFPEEGVRLPYQEYIDKGYDTSNIACTIPTSLRPYFSYVAEHVTDDIAVGILERAIQSVKAVTAEDKISEPYGKSWEYRLKWLNEALGEVSKNRGRFPGIGSLLEYLGFEHGITYPPFDLRKDLADQIAGALQETPGCRLWISTILAQAS